MSQKSKKDQQDGQSYTALSPTKLQSLAPSASQSTDGKVGNTVWLARTRPLAPSQISHDKSREEYIDEDERADRWTPLVGPTTSPSGTKVVIRSKYT